MKASPAEQHHPHYQDTPQSPSLSTITLPTLVMLPASGREAGTHWVVAHVSTPPLVFFVEIPATARVKTAPTTQLGLLIGSTLGHLVPLQALQSRVLQEESSRQCELLLAHPVHRRWGGHAADLHILIHHPFVKALAIHGFFVK